MKKYKLLITGALLVLMSAFGVAPAYAEESNNQGTFSVSQIGNDVAELKMGSNLFLAGNFVDSNKSNQPHQLNGLLFAAGNQLGIETQSDYAFVAGNMVNYNGKTDKDLFAAGNSIIIEQSAKIGRDAFIAGNSVKIDADMPGDVSITAAKVIINGINIKGDLNISTERLVIEGKANVDGKLVINSNAEIDGMGNISYAELEKYEVVEHDITATEILIGKIISIVSLFITFAIVMAMFPGVKKRVAKELNVTQFGKDVLIGMMVLLFVPIIAVFLLMSFVGAPAGLLLLGVYIAIVYLAQGYSGLWLGKLIVEKLAHGRINDFVEMLIGITVLALLVMIPWLGSYIGLLSLLLGMGLFMQSIKPNRQKNSKINAKPIQEAEVAEEKPAAKPKKSTKTVEKTTEVKEEE